MTREELQRMKDYYTSLAPVLWVYVPRDGLLDLIDSLEAARKRIDEVERQNRDLTIERDDAVRRLNEVVDRHTTQDLGTPRSGIE